MIFKTPLTAGRLIKRYKRFLADIEMDNGQIVTAHVPNSGTMLGLTQPGLEVRLSPAPSPERKFPWTLEMVHAEGIWIGVNTFHPNTLAHEAILSGRFASLNGYSSIRREVKYGQNSRIDLLLEGPDKPPLYVEVKNVHLQRLERFPAKVAEFPDSVTSRGTKHLKELSTIMQSGARALMLYIVQRNDCTAFRVADDIDPAYAAAFAMSRAAGVETLCISCAVGPTSIDIGEQLSILD